MEVDVRDVGGADDLQVLLLQLLIEKLRDQILQHLLTDIALELLANQTSGRLTGAEAGEFRAMLERADDALGLGVHGFHGHRDFNGMLATF